MKVYKPTTHVVDIGPLDTVIKLSTAGRIRCGMKTICDRCRKHITDEYFYGGFKKGHVNMKFHERCLDEQARSVVRERP